MVEQVTVRELQAELAGPNPPKLLDVREDEELQIARMAVDLHIPMSVFGTRLAEVDGEQDWVVVCHHGGRSAHVTQFLVSQGLRVRNLKGGIDSWAREIDPSIPTY